MRLQFQAAILLLSTSASHAATLSAADAAKIIRSATHGVLKAKQGQYYNPECREKVPYQAQVIDLNGDGRPEVLTSEESTCLAGRAGVRMELFIQSKTGQWQPQFGFAGSPNILPEKHGGFPDIEIMGPGLCFPVWRWNGQRYALHQGCD